MFISVIKFQPFPNVFITLTAIYRNLLTFQRRSGFYCARSRSHQRSQLECHLHRRSTVVRSHFPQHAESMQFHIGCNCFQNTRSRAITEFDRTCVSHHLRTASFMQITLVIFVMWTGVVGLPFRLYNSFGTFAVAHHTSQMVYWHTGGLGVGDKGDFYFRFNFISVIYIFSADCLDHYSFCAGLSGNSNTR